MHVQKHISSQLSGFSSSRSFNSIHHNIDCGTSCLLHCTNYNLFDLCDVIASASGTVKHSNIPYVAYLYLHHYSFKLQRVYILEAQFSKRYTCPPVWSWRPMRCSSQSAAWPKHEAFPGGQPHEANQHSLLLYSQNNKGSAALGFMQEFPKVFWAIVQ